MKKKYEPTAEQKAARDLKRKKFAELAKQIKALTPEQRDELAKRVAIVTVEGRVLSPFNSCLIAYQRDGCTMVGGFRQWIKHGRAVMKGEHGVSIWVPTGGRDDGTSGSEDAVKAEGDGEGSSCRFIAGTVFDVTQTQEIGVEVES